MECIVCYNNTTITTPITECGHKIHHKCLLKWKYVCNYNRTKLTCPYCTQPIDNMRKTRSEYRNDVKTLQELINKFHSADKLKEGNIKHNQRIRIIIEIFKVFNTNKSLIYKSEDLLKVIRERICFLKKDLDSDEYNLNKTLMRKLKIEFDKTHRILEIYTT